jgi:hypothetical protein
MGLLTRSFVRRRRFLRSDFGELPAAAVPSTKGASGIIHTGCGARCRPMLNHSGLGKSRLPKVQHLGYWRAVFLALVRRGLEFFQLIRQSEFVASGPLREGLPFHRDSSPACCNTRHTLAGLTATTSASSIMNVSRR